jgi:hypothetical protein
VTVISLWSSPGPGWPNRDAEPGKRRDELPASVASRSSRSGARIRGLNRYRLDQFGSLPDFDVVVAERLPPPYHALIWRFVDVPAEERVRPRDLRRGERVTDKEHHYGGAHPVSLA